MRTSRLLPQNASLCLLALTCIYWMAGLAVCWLSFELVMEYLSQALYQTNIIATPKP